MPVVRCAELGELISSGLIPTRHLNPYRARILLRLVRREL
jgi:hypothetical protein